MKSYILVVVLLLFLACSSNAQNFWEYSNGPYSGDVKCFAFNGIGQMFAGMSGGVYHSADNGDNWVRLGLNNVFSIAVSPQEDIYAGTFDGLYKSSDHGTNWQKLNIGSGFNLIYFIVFDNDSMIYVGTSNGLYLSRNDGLDWNFRDIGFLTSLIINNNGDLFAGCQTGVLRSTNKGDTWDDVFQSQTIREVTLMTNDSGHVFAGIYYSNTYGWVYRSTDNGENWTQLELDSTGINSLAVLENGNILAGADAGVFLSSDNGNTWISKNLIHTRTNSLAVQPNGCILAGTYYWGIYRSTDNGSSWVQINEGLEIMPVYCFALNEGRDIFAGTYMAGVFRSTDNGAHWTQLGLDRHTIASLYVSKNDYLFAGSSIDGKIFRSTNKGNTWSIHSINHSGINCFVEDKSGIIYAGVSGEGLYRSTNNGISWHPFSNIEERYVYSLAVNSKGHLVAGTASGVFRSTNNGNTWTRELLASDAGTVIMNSEGVLYAGTSDVLSEGGVYRSTDDGDTWNPVNNGITHKSVSSLSINSKNQIFAGNMEGIFYSADNGENWTSINSGLTSLRITTLISTPDNYIFAGTMDNGIFRSTDLIVPVELSSFRSTILENSVILEWTTESETNNSGFEVEKKLNTEEWKNIGFVSGNGTSTEKNSYYFIDKDLAKGSYLYRIKQIDFDGSYDYSSIVEAQVSLPINYYLSQNFPNPFNPKTKIIYSLFKQGHTIIKVFDILGNEITTLVNDIKLPGVYEIDFDASMLSSGVYFYRITSENYTNTKKLVVIK